MENLTVLKVTRKFSPTFAESELNFRDPESDTKFTEDSEILLKISRGEIDFFFFLIPPTGHT